MTSPQPNLEVSEAKLNANRANAQLSTGPRTQAGLSVSCMNNLRHGLAGAFQLLPGEDRGLFNEILSGYLVEFDPQTPAEETLVHNTVQHYWLAQRALALQNTCFEDDGTNDKKLALYLRYQVTHERGYFKCMNELHRLRKLRLAEQRGFESQQHAEAKRQRDTELHQARLVTESLRQAEIQSKQEAREAKKQEGEDRKTALAQKTGGAAGSILAPSS